MVCRRGGDHHATVVPHLSSRVLVDRDIGRRGDIGVVTDAVGDIRGQCGQCRLDHRARAGRADDRQRGRAEAVDPPGGDDVGEIGDVIAVQMGQQHRGQVRRAHPDGGSAHQHTPAAVDEERLTPGYHQGRRPGPVRVDHRTSSAGQDDFDHCDSKP